MKINWTYFFLIIGMICIINFVNAETFGYGRTEEVHINYSLIPTVNNSQYLQGYTPQQVANLFTESDALAYNGSLAFNSSLINYALKSGNLGTLDGVWSSTEVGPAKMGIDWNFARLYDIDGSWNKVDLGQGYIEMANYVLAYDIYSNGMIFGVDADLSGGLVTMGPITSQDSISAYDHFYFHSDFTSLSTNGAGDLTIDGSTLLTPKLTANGNITSNGGYFIGDGRYLSNVNVSGDYAKYQFTTNNFNGTGTITSGGLQFLNPYSSTASRGMSFFYPNMATEVGRIHYKHQGGYSFYYMGKSTNPSGNISDAFWSFKDYDGRTEIKGNTPTTAIEVVRNTGSGFAFHFFELRGTNTNTTNQLLGRLGVYGSVSQTAPPNAQYIYIDAKGSTSAYNNATLKVDANDRVGIALSGTTRPAYPLEVRGATSGITIYSETNISATGYITRTSTFDKSKGNALDLIKDSSELRDINGKIIHSNFYGFVEYDAVDYSRPVVTYGDINGDRKAEEIIEYPYKIKEQGVNIVDEIELLRQAIYELKLENQELRSLIK